MSADRAKSGVIMTVVRNLQKFEQMLHSVQHDIKERRDASHSFSMTGTKKERPYKSLCTASPTFKNILDLSVKFLIT
ncbi:MAG: hypothetical protein WC446_08725 [Candidatus Paceibacterota bacterium]